MNPLLAQSSHSTKSPSSVDLVQVPLLDGRGCLIDGALCFNEEMLPEQRAVVERHVSMCSACAHQQAELQRAAWLVRRARPGFRLSTEARTLSRQAVLRGARRSAETGEYRIVSRRRACSWFGRYRLIAAGIALGVAAGVGVFLLI